VSEKKQIPYHRFAEVYDRMEADLHSMNMFRYTLEIMQKFDIEPDTGLDLCCGTGTAVKLFHDYGIQMSGLDGSPAMIKIARDKLKTDQAKLYCQMLPKFEILSETKKLSRRLVQFDLITSFYDSLNYLLTKRDLQASFRAVHSHLSPGGWFVFDMNTPHALRTIWAEQTYSGALDDIAWVFRGRSYADRQTADALITFFVKKGKLWERFDETHTERGYDNKTIREMLKKAGFQIKGFYNCGTFDCAKVSDNRICVVAKRSK